MKLFTVRLSDDERATLEGVRKRLGLRSEADVIRAWIAEAAPPKIGPAEVRKATIENARDSAVTVASPEFQERLKGQYDARPPTKPLSGMSMKPRLKGKAP